MMHYGSGLGNDEDSSYILGANRFKDSNDERGDEPRIQVRRFILLPGFDQKRFLHHLCLRRQDISLQHGNLQGTT